MRQGSPPRRPGQPGLVGDPDSLAALLAGAARASEYALDTEFHRERTYWPRVALVQLAWREAGEPPARARAEARAPAERGGEPGRGAPTLDAGTAGGEAPLDEGVAGAARDGAPAANGGSMDGAGAPPIAGSARRAGSDVRVALIDPFGVDLTPVAGLLRGPGTLVAHAAEQDLEVLQRACGAVPVRLFDTQVAAGFTGRGSASLATLARAYLHVDVPKADRLTDWSARPLRASQLAYAAADVEHLLDLADAIRADLDRRGRRAWAEEECEMLRGRGHGQVDLARAWWKLRDARQLSGASRGVAQEVSAWRERRARRVDVPVRYVLPDLALQAIAHRPPSNRSELDAIRGLESRFLRSGVAEELLDAVARGRRLAPEELNLPPAEDSSRELRPAVALAMAWVAQLARDEAIDAALLATRADVVAFFAGQESSRLALGWRAELVGEPLRRLAAGEAALAFDGRGGLVVEQRSRRPLGRVRR